MNLKMSLNYGDTLDRYYYVNNGVIYNISSIDNGCGDAVHVSEKENKDKVPYLVVTNNSSTTNVFFDSLIEDGDYYDGSKFSKRSHIPGKDGEKYNNWFDYYIDLCKYSIGQTLASYTTKSYEFFNKNKNVFSVPEWVFKVDDGSVEIKYNGAEVVNGIEFTESLYSALKENTLKLNALDKVNSYLKPYKYHVKDIVIEKE